MKRSLKALAYKLLKFFRGETIIIIDDPTLPIPELGSQWTASPRAGSCDIVVTGWDPKTRIVTYYLGETFPVNEMCLWMFHKVYFPVVDNES
ncbi:hypothetical protein MYOV003v1_p0058 [Vibrio phage 207E48.1]|nr:hypothetical protein MYOV003v1_p0058 [Vibrio phage 207E48.1]